MSGIDNPMLYEELRDALETLLQTYETNRFRVVTEQKESTDANEHKDLLRSVQIFFSEEEPGNNSDDQNRESEVVFLLQYTAASVSKADLSILDKEDLSQSQYASALANVQRGEYLANRSLDELRRMVIQILLDPANKDFGLATYTVSSPRMRNFKKDQVLRRGSIFEVTASERFTAIVTETFEGIAPTEAEQPAINAESNFTGPAGDPDESDPSKISVDINTV